MPMELRQLRHFLTLFEHRNYHRAAERLCITPQALSASIAKLEQELSVPLFERGRVGLVPTHYADALFTHASLVCSETVRARQALEQLLKTEAGRVNVGVGWFTSQILAAAALERFFKEYPAFDVTLLEGPSEDLYTQLLRGELDIVLSTPSADTQLAPEIESETLWESTDRVYARGGHPLAGQAVVGLAELVEYPWIVSAGTESRTPRLLRACDEHNIPRPARILRTDSVQTVDRLISGGDFLLLGGPLPPPFRLPFMQDCATFEVPELQSHYRAVLAWRRTSSLSAAAQRLRETIRTTFRESER
jgi:DNA-binding transcriptional LysR family regulator